MKTVAKTFVEVVGVLILVFGSWWLGWAMRAAQSAPEPDLPSIVEIQRLVGAVPDGKLGPETQDKWNRMYCDQEAAKCFTRAGQ